jgi:hypothetical protein
VNRFALVPRHRVVGAGIGGYGATGIGVATLLALEGTAADRIRRRRKSSPDRTDPL